MFRSQRDAELTKVIYRRVPVLIDRTRRRGGNPWGIRFFTMFHQTNDAELFHTAEQLQQMRFRPEGSRWRKGKRLFLPLYEAKMVQAYDHRAAGVVVQAGNWVRQGQTEATTLVSHQNPEFTVTPRWWIAQEAVDNCFQDDDGRTFFVGFKDITSPTNQRTMIAAAIPYCGVTNHFPLILNTKSPCLQMCLLANLNALVLDYVARQKIGGVTLNFFIVEQFPMFPPSAYEKPCPWDRRTSLKDWISQRVLKLTCTADDIRPLAEAADFAPVVTRWDPHDRAELQAELDAAFFLLYGIGLDDAEYILSTFKGLRPKDDGTLKMFNSPDLILDAYDRLSGAS